MSTSSLLHDACDRDDLSASLQIISTDSATVKALGKFDRTPLHIAAKTGNVKLCQALLQVVSQEEQPHYLSLRTSHGFTALYCAVLSGNADIVELLTSAYPVDLEAADLGGLTPLHVAAEKGYAGAVSVLLRAGSDATATDSIGRTALDWALAKSHEDCIELLQHIASKNR